MKKVLILAYDFPPFNSIGGQRPYSWYRYLKNKNFEPTVITRQWDESINSQIESIKSSENQNPIIEKSEFGTIIRAPYKSTYRDNLILKYGFERKGSLRKLITFYYNTFRYYRSSIDFTYPIYLEAKKHLSENYYDVIIATGEPFILLKYADKLSKLFDTPWIADYRDGWSTNIVYTWDKSFFAKYSRFINRFFEKRVITSSALITTASESDRAELTKLHINKECIVILNGWDEDKFVGLNEIPQNKDIFTIAYAGMVYTHQELECFFDGIKLFLDKNSSAKVQIIFYGANYHPEQKQRIILASKWIENIVTTTDRINHDLVIKKLAQANLLLLLASTKVNHLAAKVYDYLAVNRRILLVKNDHGLLEEFIKNCNAGVSCEDENDVCKIMQNLYDEFLSKSELPSNSININKYSRRNQSLVLSKVFNNVLKLESEYLSGHDLISNSAKLKNDFRNIIFKVGYKLKFDVLSRKLSSFENSIPVLCFHNISDGENLAYPAIKVDDFEQIIKYLKQNFQIINLEEIGKIKPKNKSVAITFDDGYKDFLENALPILSHYNAPCTQHIVVDCTNSGSVFWTLRLNRIFNLLYKHRSYFRIQIGEIFYSFHNYKTFKAFSQQIFIKLLNTNSAYRNEIISNLEHNFNLNALENEIMTWDDIRYCLKKGVSIGSHSYSHDSLTSVIDDGLLRHEIFESKKIIEHNLATTVNSLAFPNGMYNDKIAELSRKAGYKFLLNTDELKHVISNKSEQIISRISVNKDSFYENILKINNFHNLVHKPHGLTKQN